MCAISVCLTETQLPFYLVQSVPQLSLSKYLNQSWASVGLFVKNCAESTVSRSGPNSMKSRVKPVFQLATRDETAWMDEAVEKGGMNPVV